MIKSITVTNHRSESITLELKRPEKSGFIVLDADGLVEPVKATINTSTVATLDGTLYNSARLGQRDIVLNLQFMEVWEETANGPRIKETIEDVRLKSYRFFPERRQIKIVIETDNHIVETYGYVDHNKPSVFSSTEGSSITILCNDPYLYSIKPESVMFSGVVPKFTFPFSNPSLTEKQLYFGEIIYKTDEVVYYDGHADAGMTIVIEATGAVKNLVIHNTTCHERMSISTDRLELLTGKGIVAGDTIVIDTRKRHKSITLVRDGEKINIMNCLERGTDWLSLIRGDNVIAYRAAEGGMNIRFKVEYKNAYEGV